MSSHHFVREDQEPALFIMHADAVSFETVQELLEWSPRVMVTEESLDAVIRWGIKVDIVIALNENVNLLRSALQDQFPLKLLSISSAEEALSTALYFLIASKQRTVNILSDLPLKSFERYGALDLIVFQSGKKWSFIRSGKFEKWLPPVTLHILAQSAEVHTNEKEGLVRIQRKKGFWISEE